MEWWVAERAGFTCWSDAWKGVEIRFLGKGPPLTVPETVHRIAPSSHQPSWLRQVHGSRAVQARPGCVAEADALVDQGDGHRQALTVVTADCVPLLWAGPCGIAAIHAGWRGIEAGVIRATLGAQRSAPSRAWIGPAIGACCYEVGEDVAARVVAASGPGVVVQPTNGRRPHLDLVAAVKAQLANAGVDVVKAVDVCTQCQAEQLWSYRREGPKAGRNLAVIWRK